MDWNRWAAEVVMGWHIDDYCQEFYRDSQYQIMLVNQWNPLTDLNHLFMVIEKMRELGWNIEIFSIRDYFRIRFLHPMFVNKDSEYDDPNLNIAVLEAAKKALA